MDRPHRSSHRQADGERGGGAGLADRRRAGRRLSNIYRLGLIWFSRESLADPAPYQVLEAQPEAVEAIRRAGRARIVRRSIHLTPFGRHFCEHTLPLSDEPAPAAPEA